VNTTRKQEEKKLRSLVNKMSLGWSGRETDERRKVDDQRRIANDNWKKSMPLIKQ
jgi:hypothetical protein